MPLNVTRDWKSVELRPWVGDQYESPTVLSGRTLLLGESEYGAHQFWHPDRTIENTQSHIDQAESWNRFWTKVRRIVLGPTTKVERDTFWRQVAFYNFIQFYVGDSARIRPEPEMWRDSVPAFEEILSVLRPQYVLVLGTELWKALTGTGAIGIHEIDRNKFSIGFDGLSTVTGYVAHPSSFGFSYSKWHTRACEILNLSAPTADMHN